VQRPHSSLELPDLGLTVEDAVDRAVADDGEVASGVAMVGRGHNEAGGKVGVSRVLAIGRHDESALPRSTMGLLHTS
jgi:hypothetical protein